MPRYRRYTLHGTVFVTVVTYRRRHWLTDDVEVVLAAMRECRVHYPYRHLGHVLLPDHLHWMFEPAGSDFSRIVAAFKRNVTLALRQRGETRTLWQPRFYDHLIRDDADFQRHLDYLHFNPVKHGYCLRPDAWPHTSFHAWLARGGYDAGWGMNEPQSINGMTLD